MDKGFIQILVCGDKEPAKMTFSSVDEMAEALKKLEEENKDLGGYRAVICSYYWVSTPLTKAE